MNIESEVNIDISVPEHMIVQDNSEWDISIRVPYFELLGQKRKI